MSYSLSVYEEITYSTALEEENKIAYRMSEEVSRKEILKSVYLCSALHTVFTFFLASYIINPLLIIFKNLVTHLFIWSWVTLVNTGGRLWAVLSRV